MSHVQNGDLEQSRIILRLLDSVARDEAVSQRRLAADLGIALGLVNAYLKRCVKKGWVKVSEAPARRYLYYLTPHGFAEKSRLTVEYLSYSFSFFRAARADCVEALAAASDRGCKRILLAGVSDLAEIAMICALEANIDVVGVLEPGASESQFLGQPIVRSLVGPAKPCDGALLTDVKTPADTFARAVEHFGADHVFVPALLSGRIRNAVKVASETEAAE